MHLFMLVLLGTLASIGALTIFACICVIRFGDSALSDINAW